MGVGQSLATCVRFLLAFVPLASRAWQVFTDSVDSSARGVGHNPNSVSSVSGVDGTSRNNKRLAGVTDSFQVRKHTVEFHADDSKNIFTNDPSGPGCLDNFKHRRPEMAVICLASA